MELRTLHDCLHEFRLTSWGFHLPRLQTVGVDGLFLDPHNSFRADLSIQLAGTLNMQLKRPARFSSVRKRVFCFLAQKRAVAGFDRQLAGATHKWRLKRRLSDLSEAIFNSDFGETKMTTRLHPA